MLGKFLQGFRRAANAESAFAPIFSLAQLAQIGQLPIIDVRAFTCSPQAIAEGAAGRGIGGILANLLRRNLLFTRAVSVIGGEDSGFLAPAAGGEEDAAQFATFATATVVGRLHSESATQFALQLRVIPHLVKGGGDETLLVRFATDRIAGLGSAVATAISQRLGVSIAPDVVERWQQQVPKSWDSLLQAGRLWQQNDWAGLAALHAAGSIHPDALSPLSDDTPDEHAARRGLDAANRQEPDNPQLAFNSFCTRWQGRERPAPALEAILRPAIAAAPGHGKAHMVFPHILAATRGNAPYLLAHSEVGYRLLRHNSFALANFSNYLNWLAPQDERVLPLLLQSIEIDPESSSGYLGAIDSLLKNNRPRDAEKVAKALLELCTPPIPARTIYSFRQNPACATEMDRGEFDPQQYALDILRQCQQRIG